MHLSFSAKPPNPIVYVCESGLERWRKNGQEFKGTLGYIANLMSAGAT